MRWFERQKGPGSQLGCGFFPEYNENPLNQGWPEPTFLCCMKLGCCEDESGLDQGGGNEDGRTWLDKRCVLEVFLLYLDPFKNCHYPTIKACVRAQSLQSCPTLWDPMDYSLPGCSIHGILQARILVWIAMPSSRGPPRSRGQTHVSSFQTDSLPSEPPGKPLTDRRLSLIVNQVMFVEWMTLWYTGALLIRKLSKNYHNSNNHNIVLFNVISTQNRIYIWGNWSPERLNDVPGAT